MPSCQQLEQWRNSNKKKTAVNWAKPPTSFLFELASNAYFWLLRIKKMNQIIDKGDQNDSVQKHLREEKVVYKKQQQKKKTEVME